MYLVDMQFIEMEKITAQLTEQHKAYLEQEYKNGKLMFGGRKSPELAVFCCLGTLHKRSCNKC